MSANGSWHVLYTDSPEWTKVRTSNTLSTSIDFGDFDGNGTTDAFRLLGGQARVSFSTRDRGQWSDWENVGRYVGDTSVADLGFGDFDGDGVTDVLRAYRGSLEVAFATRDRSQWSTWRRVKTSKARVALLRLGDFDGDGVTDAFRRGSDERWYVSYATSDRTPWTDWTVIGSSHVPLGELGFGDFDGDGATDVLRSQGRVWYASYSANGRGSSSLWTRINRSPVPVATLSFSDVNGDGSTDAIFAERVTPS